MIRFLERFNKPISVIVTLVAWLLVGIQNLVFGEISYELYRSTEGLQIILVTGSIIFAIIIIVTAGSGVKRRKRCRYAISGFRGWLTHHHGFLRYLWLLPVGNIIYAVLILAAGVVGMNFSEAMGVIVAVLLYVPVVWLSVRVTKWFFPHDAGITKRVRIIPDEQWAMECGPKEPIARRPLSVRLTNAVRSLRVRDHQEGRESPSLPEQLEKLHELYTSGALTDEEFQKTKRRIIDS